MPKTNRATAFRSILTNPRTYPAAVLALAGIAVGIAPVTASAATAPTTPTTITTTAAAKNATAAKNTTTPATTTSTNTTGAKTTTAAHTTTATAHTTAAVAAQPATRSASPFAGASTSALEPTGTVGTQSHITLTADQWANATAIVHTAENMHLTPYAATIAVATSMQESKLQNLTVAVDHDSLGLFQQRPSCGWGTPTQLEDPTYAATAFLKNLPTNYQNLPLHTAAQDVQGSFNGYLYAQWEDQASHIVSTIVNS